MLAVGRREERLQESKVGFSRRVSERHKEKGALSVLGSDLVERSERVLVKSQRRKQQTRSRVDRWACTKYPRGVHSETRGGDSLLTVTRILFTF